MGASIQNVTSDLGGMDWKSFWLIPSVMALVVMLFFAILFKEPKAAKPENVS
jgi:hypothetical protein